MEFTLMSPQETLTPPKSPQEPLTPPSPMSPLSPILGALSINDVGFTYLNQEERDDYRDSYGQDAALKASRDIIDREEGRSFSAKRQRPVSEEEEEEDSPNKRVKGEKEEKTNWVFTHHKEEPLKNHLMVTGFSSTKIPWSGSAQEGAFLRAPEASEASEKVPKDTLLSYYASDRKGISAEKFKKLLRQDPEAIAYMVQLTVDGETVYVDGSKSQDPSAKINHKWSPLLTNVEMHTDGRILTTCPLLLFPGTSVELFMSYGEVYWYHRLCKDHELYIEDKDFDEISEESQEVLSAYMRVVLPDNVDKLTEEEQIVYMSHWDS